MNIGILKQAAFLILTFGLFISCPSNKNNDDTQSIGGSSTGNSSFSNLVSSIELGRNDTQYNSWDEIPWSNFGLTISPQLPSGGKLELAAKVRRSRETPILFISNVTETSFESFCNEISSVYNNVGTINNQVSDQYLYDLDFPNWDECYEISLGHDMRIADVLHESGTIDRGVFISTSYYLRIYYFGSPNNGIFMRIVADSYL